MNYNIKLKKLLSITVDIVYIYFEKVDLIFLVKGYGEKTVHNTPS